MHMLQPAFIVVAAGETAEPLVIAPQVKIGPNGQLMIDHSSLVQQPVDVPVVEYVLPRKVSLA